MENIKSWREQYKENPVDIIEPRMTRKILSDRYFYLLRSLEHYEDRFVNCGGREKTGIEILDNHFWTLYHAYKLKDEGMKVCKSISGRWFVLLS